MNQKVLRVLRKLENIKGRESAFWNVPRTTGGFLAFMVRAAGARKVLEIGTSNGYSGLYIADALAHNQGFYAAGGPCLLFTVESNPARFEAARGNFARAGMSKYVRQIFGHALEVLGAVVLGVSDADSPAGREFDLIFLDATKMEYRRYAEAVLPLLRTGGLMIADNCVSHADELRDFMRFLEERSDLQNVLLPFDNGLMMSLKVA